MSSSDSRDRLSPHSPQRSSPAKANRAPGPSAGICRWIRYWLWPGWSATCSTRSRNFHPPPPSPRRRDSSDCKSCRDRKVDCDHARPQCAHCYEQQLLCFYVTLKKSKPKRKSKHASSASQSTTTESNARQAQSNDTAA